MHGDQSPRFVLEKYYVQRNEYFIIVDTRTEKPIPKLPGVASKEDYQPLLDLLNLLHEIKLE